MSEKIEKIMEWEEAEKKRDEILDKLGAIDLDKITSQKPEGMAARYEKLIVQGIMVGKVYYDEEKGCLVQELFNPITVGTLTPRTHFYFKNKYKVRDSKASRFEGMEATTEMLQKVCELPMTIIDELTGLDLEMSMACLNFFLK